MNDIRKSKAPTKSSNHEILLRMFPSCAVPRQPSSTTPTATPSPNRSRITLLFEQSQETRMRADIEASQIVSLRAQLVELYLRLKPSAHAPTLPPVRIRRQTAGLQTIPIPVHVESSTAMDEPRLGALDELMGMTVLPLSLLEEARYNVLLATERHGAILGSWYDLNADGVDAARALAEAQSLWNLTEVRMKAVLQE